MHEGGVRCVTVYVFCISDVDNVHTDNKIELYTITYVISGKVHNKRPVMC